VNRCAAQNQVPNRVFQQTEKPDYLGQIAVRLKAHPDTKAEFFRSLWSREIVRRFGERSLDSRGRLSLRELLLLPQQFP
jgi:hypothetical protein